jgi:hypothetical protein
MKDFTSLILRLLSKASHQRGPAPVAWSGCHTRSQDGASFQGSRLYIFCEAPCEMLCLQPNDSQFIIHYKSLLCMLSKDIFDVCDNCI